MSALIVIVLVLAVLLGVSKSRVNDDHANKRIDEKKYREFKTVHIIWLVVILVLCAPLFMEMYGSMKPTDAIVQPTHGDSIEIASSDRADSIERIAAIRRDSVLKAGFRKTPAGKIQDKHPEWSDEDCTKLANHNIWIGMSISMVIYERGGYSSRNISDYGSGKRYQYCWEGFETNCFYCGKDGIVISYN